MSDLSDRVRRLEEVAEAASQVSEMPPGSAGLDIWMERLRTALSALPSAPLSPEVERLERQRDEAGEALREASAAFVAKDNERLRLILCDMNARTRAHSLRVAAEAERDEAVGLLRDLWQNRLTVEWDEDAAVLQPRIEAFLDKQKARR